MPSHDTPGTAPTVPPTVPPGVPPAVASGQPASDPAATRQVLQPPGWAPPKGYANGVAVPAGRLVFVAGQIGWNARCEFESDDFVDQARLALANVRDVLAEAGARGEHIVRMTWYVTSRAEYLARAREVGRAYRELIGSYAVAMTAVEVSALMEARARIEIEATAVVPAP